MITLSDNDVKNICKQYNIKLDGIFNRNNIPKNICEGFYILNLDKTDNEGTHWTAFIIRNKQPHIYFDSFGYIPPQDLDKMMQKYIYNNKKIQSLHSSSCGWFSLMFLFFIQNDTCHNALHSFEKFINIFSDMIDDNERILKYFFESA